MKDDLINAIAELDEERALQLVRDKVQEGETPLEIVEQCRLGLEQVGKRYSEETYEQFIRKLNETGATILGISVVLTFSINYVKKLIKLLKEAGLRDKVKVVIGGYPVNEMIREYTGADYFETDAKRAVKLFRRISRLEED